MLSLRLSALFLLLTCSAQATAYEGVTLQYEPNERVTQTHTFDWTLDLEIPGNRLTNRVQQTFECSLVLVAQGTEPVEQAPFTIDLVFQRIAFDTETNGVQQKFDTSQEGNSAQLALLRQMIGRPLRLEIGSDYLLPKAIPALQEMHARLPMLDQLMPESMVREILQYGIAFAGQQVAVGHQCTQELNIGSALAVTMPLKYEVVRANFKEIEANLTGSLPPQKRDLAAAFNDKAWWGSLSGSLQIEGKVQGKSSWRRRNALLCQMKLEQEYKGQIVLGTDGSTSTAPVRGRWTHQIESQRQ